VDLDAVPYTNRGRSGPRDSVRRSTAIAATEKRARRSLVGRRSLSHARPQNAEQPVDGVGSRVVESQLDEPLGHEPFRVRGAEDAGGSAPTENPPVGRFEDLRDWMRGGAAERA
jgi:hypothetical protein